MTTEREAWLRGPIPGIPPLLMPVAHALVQVVEDVEASCRSLTVAELWSRPGGAASIGFHLKHLPGSLDRLFTYARGEALTPAQLERLRAETVEGEPDSVAPLIDGLHQAVEAAVAQLAAADPEALTEPRAVGRARLPSSVGGLLFHAAEHAARHSGQIATTLRIVRGLGGGITSSSATRASRSG